MNMSRSSSHSSPFTTSRGMDHDSTCLSPLTPISAPASSTLNVPHRAVSSPPRRFRVHVALRFAVAMFRGSAHSTCLLEVSLCYWLLAISQRRRFSWIGPRVYKRMGLNVPCVFFLVSSVSGWIFSVCTAYALEREARWALLRWRGWGPGLDWKCSIAVHGVAMLWVIVAPGTVVVAGGSLAFGLRVERSCPCGRTVAGPT